jgi:DUF2924 family protein
VKKAVQAGVIAQIEALRGMTVGQLRLKWRELYGEDTLSGNRDHLWRRLAWRVQELAYGGLSERAKARITELSQSDDLRMLPPRGWQPTNQRPTSGPVRDRRIPKPGAVLSRRYHGQEIRVTVLEDGFEWDGRRFKSLSALAREVTGQRWNGLLFFGLTKGKR